MTPSKGDPDHAVNLSSVHGMCTYLCVCAVHLCTYMRVCMYVYVSINNQAALYRCYAKSPNTIITVCVATHNLSGKKD